MADKREFQARHEERSFPSSQLPPEAAATKATSDSFTEDASNFRAVAAILVFSITDEASFAKLQEWVRELQGNVEEPLVLAIACNKADLTAQRTVSYDTASQYAASIGALIFETSAKRDTGAHPEPQPYAASPCTLAPARAPRPPLVHR